MSVVYPDNENREARVHQLITQTSTLQSLFTNIEDNIKKTNDDATKLVETLSKHAGYSTVDQYCQAGLNALSPAEKNNYENMFKTLVRHNSPLKNSQVVFGAIGTLGVFLKIGIPKIVNICCKFGAFVVGMQGILRGLILMFKGAFEDGWATVRVFATMIKGNYQRAIHVGQDITERTATSLRWLNRAGKVLQWGGILAEVGMFIYTVVEGAKQKEILQNAIIETCCTRFGVKKIQLLMNQTLLWNSKVAGIVSTMHFYQQKMEEQKVDPPASPGMLITQDAVDKDIQKSIDKLIDSFDQELKDCNADTKVVGELGVLDDSSSSGERAWTSEDPNISEMKKWIDEHPLKDDKGNVVPIEGPAFYDVGLQWTGDKVAADKGSVTVTFTGKNETDKGQRFRALHLSFPVGTKASTALFTETSFVKKESAASGNAAVDIVAGNGVTGVSKDFTATFKPEDNCVKINIVPANGQEMITLPVKESIKFVITGTTSKAGTTACLVREEWYPFKDMNWEDILVHKE